MKRSEINRIMRSVLDFLAANKFCLPPFAYWSPDEWKQKGPEVAEIIENQLGWDIIDFGSGDFSKSGLFLFTIRNGKLADVPKGGKSYAEKVLISSENQITPMHFHYSKMEDIINRGGGVLV
nr:D-lyxose/D-mannose family sugar isomerase [Candidatus Sigynarchaeota archaeon]